MSQVSRKEIAEAVLALLKSGKTQVTVAQELADYLVAERRTKDLAAILREVETLRFNRDGILEADATSAYELTPAIQAQVKELFKAKKTLLDYQHDPELVGGLRVRSLDHQLDLSIASKLNQLKHANLGA